MFPLKQRRRYVRLEDKIEAVVLSEGAEFVGLIKDISGGGCKLKFKTRKNPVPENKEIVVRFAFKEEVFEVKAKRIADCGFEFLFESKDEQSKLNLLIVKEYLKDTPELINEKYIK